MTSLRTAEDRWPPGGGMTSVERMVAANWPHIRTKGMPTEVAPAGGLSPTVNHGRWVINCPGCPSASLASRRDLRFFCCTCSNALDDGRWLPVTWPADADRIERVLASRRDRTNRNWAPPETLVDLLAENVLHGLVG